jgi:hypothetical protein
MARNCARLATAVAPAGADCVGEVTDGVCDVTLTPTAALTASAAMILDMRRVYPAEEIFTARFRRGYRMTAIQSLI